jgi:hypothetical protein
VKPKKDLPLGTREESLVLNLLRLRTKAAKPSRFNRIPKGFSTKYESFVLNSDGFFLNLHNFVLNSHSILLNLGGFAASERNLKRFRTKGSSRVPRGRSFLVSQLAKPFLKFSNKPIFLE